MKTQLLEVLGTNLCLPQKKRVLSTFRSFLASTQVAIHTHTSLCITKERFYALLEIISKVPTMLARCCLFALVCLLVVLCCCTVPIQAGSISCLDENGMPVDWWFIHKLPSVSNVALSEQGFAYSYMDPKHDLALTGKRLDTNLKGALGSTLSQYLGKNGPAYLQWSDQPPDGSQTSRAHAKGVMSFDQGGGFFLRHSTPRFPNMASDGPYQGMPVYERLYGQSYLCITLNMPSINQVASQFLINNPSVYDSFVPGAVEAQYPNITKLANAGYLKGINSQMQIITSKGGQPFIDFAKSKYCNCELYSQLVAPTLNDDMAVLSWGRPLMSSGCKPQVLHDVLNIQGIHITSQLGNTTYNETKEHSKWGITAKSNHICVGDINRMSSQAKRGGGTTCFKSPSLWSSLSREISVLEFCSII